MISKNVSQCVSVSPCVYTYLCVCLCYSAVAYSVRTAGVCIVYSLYIIKYHWTTGIRSIARSLHYHSAVHIVVTVVFMKWIELWLTCSPNLWLAIVKPWEHGPQFCPLYSWWEMCLCPWPPLPIFPSWLLQHFSQQLYFVKVHGLQLWTPFFF